VKTYSSIAALRANLAEALDAVEEDGAVEIVRRGRTFRIVEVRAKPSPRRLPAPFFEVDPELLEKGWTWSQTDDGGLDLVVGKARRPRRKRPAGR
jgi:prevent-host-death family protein